MSKLYRDHCIQAIVLWVVFLVLFLLSRPVIGFAENPPPLDLIRSGSMKIEGKTNTAIIVGERHFIVTESTTILNVNEKKIHLIDLPIPCKATIEYQLRMDQDPLTLKILIKQVLPGSSTLWPPPGPE